MRELLAELTATLDQGRDGVWCALVETRGSTPQKAGAAMLVLADGSQRGTLGGGCVEAEVKQRALRVLATGAPGPEVLTFALDDNYGWDDGLICGGRMTIVADPVTGARRADQTAYYGRFHQLVEEGRGCTEAVIVAERPGGQPAVGSRYLFDEHGDCTARLANGPPPEEVVGHLTPLHKRPAASLHHGVAYLPVLPRITLLLVGGGHVGHAVARLAAEVDFDIWVLDDRERFASRERFPTASRRLVGDIGGQLKQLAPELGPSVYAIILTRGHAHDEEALYHLAPLTLPSPPGGEGRVRGIGYVGMIGSKRKIRLIYEDLLAKGVSAEALERVHAPLGFDIGSQTVPEIAVSIVAELIACRNKGQTIRAARIHVPLGTSQA